MPSLLNVAAFYLRRRKGKGKGEVMVRLLIAYVCWFLQICYQFYCGLYLRWMVWRFPAEARIAATRARWHGTQDDDPAMLKGALIIEELLARQITSRPAD